MHVHMLPYALTRCLRMLAQACAGCIIGQCSCMGLHLGGLNIQTQRLAAERRRFCWHFQRPQSYDLATQVLTMQRGASSCGAGLEGASSPFAPQLEVRNFLPHNPTLKARGVTTWPSHQNTSASAEGARVAWRVLASELVAI